MTDPGGTKWNFVNKSLPNFVDINIDGVELLIIQIKTQIDDFPEITNIG
jgi:hypothetical protein